jgi:hypothetical protein
MSEEEVNHEEGENTDQTFQENLDPSGFTERTFSSGRTLKFVTQLELIQLFVRRMKQINDPNSPHNRFAPSVTNKLGNDASFIDLLCAEILDTTFKYPLMLKRGDGYLRVHKDLAVYETIVDYFVTVTRDGGISFDPINTTYGESAKLFAKEIEDYYSYIQTMKLK